MKLNTKIFYVLSLLLFFTKQESEPISINFNGTIYKESKENINGTVTYKISVTNSSSYLKITASGKVGQHVISYYKNEKAINEREQLSQSSTETTIMYLTKKQCESQFFISVQCTKTPCSFDFILESKDYAELNLDDDFSYYVTESNKHMEFKISGAPNTSSTDQTNGNNVITIYAIGNLEINTTLNTSNFTKHKTKNAYLIKINDLNKSVEYILTVNGSPGDLINIGSHFHDSNSISNKVLSENNRFIFGYLKKDTLQKNCFKVKSSENIKLYTLNLEYMPIQTLVNSSESINGINFYCVEVSNETDYDEIFYLAKIYNENNSNYFNALQPQILDSRFEYYVKEGITQAFYCTLAKRSNLNYEISALQSIYEISYYECDSFPFCEINDSIIKNSTKIKNFNCISNLELDENNLKTKSAISQKQYLILLTCKSSDKTGRCSFFNYFYSNNYLLSYIFSVNRYLLKDKETSIRTFSIWKDTYSLYISLIVYSGKIKVEIKNNTYNLKKYEYDRQYFYIITKKKENDIIGEVFLNITAEENSFYSIRRVDEEEGASDRYESLSNLITSGSHYVFSLNNLTRKLINSAAGFLYERGKLYTGFKTYNCKANITKIGIPNPDEDSINLDNTDCYSKDILTTQPDQYAALYSVNSIDKNQDNCFLNIYSYLLKTKAEYDSNTAQEIFLIDKIPQKFIFDEDVKYTKFLYPNVEINTDLVVEIKVPDKANFSVTKFFNNEKQNDTEYITSNKIITIKKDGWKNICKDSLTVCGVSFGVSLESKGNATSFEITVRHENQKGNVIILYVLVGVGGAILLIIVLLLVFILKCKSKNDRLTKDVNTTSFQEERFLNE